MATRSSELVRKLRPNVAIERGLGETHSVNIEVNREEAWRWRMMRLEVRVFDLLSFVGGREGRSWVVKTSNACVCQGGIGNRPWRSFLARRQRRARTDLAPRSKDTPTASIPSVPRVSMRPPAPRSDRVPSSTNHAVGAFVQARFVP
eukprot:scaffold316_cov352-Pavlova_lutheri.AAC.40